VRETGSRIRIILTEGKNRQIRRMIESVGLAVVRLKRIRIMNVQLGHLPVGQWRKFRKDEVAALLARLK
jgi:23S rRNA pseudouridine2604 synthase